MTSQTGQMQKVPDFYLQSITEILPSVLLHHTNPKGLVLLISGPVLQEGARHADTEEEPEHAMHGA